MGIEHHLFVSDKKSKEDTEAKLLLEKNMISFYEVPVDPSSNFTPSLETPHNGLFDGVEEIKRYIESIKSG